MIIESFLLPFIVLFKANELETKGLIPITNVNVSYLIGGLCSIQKLVKFDSKQVWKNKGEKLRAWFADCLRKLHSRRASSGGIDKICSTFELLWSNVRSRLGSLKRNL